MLSQAEIFAANPGLNAYQVAMREHKEDPTFSVFNCYAETQAHASEQAINAYPNGAVESVSLVTLGVTPQGQTSITAKEMAGRHGHAKSSNNTCIKTKVNPDASDVHEEKMDLWVHGVGNAAYFHWASEYGDPIGHQFFVLKGEDATSLVMPDVSLTPGIDWQLLRTQKSQLVSMAHDSDRPTVEIEVLDGVIALIDHIQDDAVAKGSATESVVFGPKWLIYSYSEGAGMDCAGWWSNENGWTARDGATVFTDAEKLVMFLPNASGEDAIWQEYSEMQDNSSAEDIPFDIDAGHTNTEQQDAPVKPLQAVTEPPSQVDAMVIQIAATNRFVVHGAAADADMAAAMSLITRVAIGPQGELIAFPNATHIAAVWSENTGGGSMVDFIKMRDGRTLTLSDEAISFYQAPEDFYAGQENGVEKDLWSRWLNDKK